MNRPHTPGFLALVAEAKKNIREIDIKEYVAMRERGEEHLLVDVREDHEYEAGHAAGAKHLGKGIIERDMETEVPDMDTHVVLYCGGGYRSALATEALQKIGYRNLISLDGGWTAYEASGLPIER
jgi:rhodanese-related sulfurtransferase